MTRFKLRPILSEMKALYAQPISPARFQDYLAKLQGDTKGDLALPLGGFNPMAKEHVLHKIAALEQLSAEAIMEQVIADFNVRTEGSSEQEITVVLNLADDLKGAWTNYYTTDFDSKFKLNAFVQRQFCVPYFWTSETYTEALIQTRTLAQIVRTCYRLEHPQPKSLKDHLAQEIVVADQLGQPATQPNEVLEKMDRFYQTHQNTEDYDLIFNFFYGEEGAESLGYKSYGITLVTGFDYASAMVARRKN